MLDKKNVKPAKTRAKDPGKRKIGKVIRKQPATKRKEDSGNLPDIVPKEESLSKKKTPGLTIMSDQKRILDNIPQHMAATTTIQFIAMYLPFYESGIPKEVTSTDIISALEVTKDAASQFADIAHDTIFLPKIGNLADTYIQNIKSHVYSPAELKYLVFKFNASAEEMIHIIDRCRKYMLRSLSLICDITDL